MAQWLRAKPANLEDPDLIPSTDVMVPNHFSHFLFYYYSFFFQTGFSV